MAAEASAPEPEPDPLDNRNAEPGTLVSAARASNKEQDIGAGRPAGIVSGFDYGAVMEWKIELVFVPVSDVDRAKSFYVDQVGFNADYD
ncbi:MAG TPA: hypothetical protein VGJ19_17540, partial [Streptosporangiaceae bacterium]